MYLYDVDLWLNGALMSLSAGAFLYFLISSLLFPINPKPSTVSKGESSAQGVSRRMRINRVITQLARPKVGRKAI
ncbi:hypothetical protein [Spirosoma sp. KNUC1025]|uniref:hypothetical protein n=1 Tax=Spirosoma sp. KNUC1025 TaxID=2894082 RepID=UPI0038686D80|nr:hypothetical protein LN737_19425 [Spirosoma sp. KNUC1025]